jgi:hypothetical protein
MRLIVANIKKKDFCDNTKHVLIIIKSNVENDHRLSIEQWNSRSLNSFCKN